MKNKENKVEQYIRYPGTLSEQERSEIRSLIENEPALRRLADWFREFYSLADEAISAGARPHSIKLFPSRPKTGTQNNRFVLAAMTPKNPAEQIDSVITYVSEQEHTILRVLKNYAKNTLDLHLISPHLGDDESAILFIPEKELHLATKPGGKLSLPFGEPWTPDDMKWETCEISLPLATVGLEDLLQKAEFDTGGRFKIMTFKKDDSIQISVKSSDNFPVNCKMLIHYPGTGLPRLHFLGGWSITISGKVAVDTEGCTLSFYT